MYTRHSDENGDGGWERHTMDKCRIVGLASPNPIPPPPSTTTTRIVDAIQYIIINTGRSSVSERKTPVDMKGIKRDVCPTIQGNGSVRCTVVVSAGHEMRWISRDTSLQWLSVYVVPVLAVPVAVIRRNGVFSAAIKPCHPSHLLSVFTHASSTPPTLVLIAMITVDDAEYYDYFAWW